MFRVGSYSREGPLEEGALNRGITVWCSGILQIILSDRNMKFELESCIDILWNYLDSLHYKIEGITLFELGYIYYLF